MPLKSDAKSRMMDSVQAMCDSCRTDSMPVNKPEHEMTIKFNGDFNMAGLMQHFHRLGSIGASRSVHAFDEDDKPVKFGWDGDGADKIVSCTLDGQDILK
jgi:hypothetical protein